MPLPYYGYGERSGVAAAMAPSDEGAAERQRSWGREIPFGLTEAERRQVGYGRKFVQRENCNISPHCRGGSVTRPLCHGTTAPRYQG